MKNFEENLLAWLFATMLAVGLLYPIFSDAQNVRREGNTFIQEGKKQQSTPPTLTSYKYRTSDGKEYPVYLSANGKAFIIRTSKSGKQYRQYLPEVTAQINRRNGKD